MPITQSCPFRCRLPGATYNIDQPPFLNQHHLFSPPCTPPFSLSFHFYLCIGTSLSLIYSLLLTSTNTFIHSALSLVNTRQPPVCFPHLTPNRRDNIAAEVQQASKREKKQLKLKHCCYICPFIRFYAKNDLRKNLSC